MTQVMKLADGRQLTYDIFGDPHGVPVIFSHGYSDSHLIRHPNDFLTRSIGVRWIAADQPGVGGSTAKNGRRMVDWGADMEQLANHLALDRFNVAGHSGGGPHALSIAYRMPERVGKVVLASPVAPFDDKAVTGMLVLNELKAIVKMRHLHHVLRWLLKAEARRINKNIPAYVAATAKMLPRESRTILRNPAQQALFEDNFRAAFAQKEEGIYEMTLALWNWGFSPRDIRPPVEIFYGNNDGIISPRMPLYLSEQLPSAKAHEWNGANHYSFVDEDCWIDFITAARG
ncbi:Pimeloyl-ACP methyl ester carboxylesterase [Microbulbifer donghaiensis]|uniref:Pimeloyl-ACP methyl ester carboxylesterase n=1 Tax=Microbulbifer donghaiensis TaxID=494016 RepID=A0A1M4W3A4_9GAMM|nr:alpha/beta hydrolase [Microbulbifer donghaiensis]SHE75751.1 Pimeloyl-ACP methyl ester carboxylesterase [Microbulbifer donghaiensis]